MPAASAPPRVDCSPALEGYPLLLRLPDRDVVLWWGRDAQGTDRVAVAEGRVLGWDSVEACLAAGDAYSVTLADDADAGEPDVMDLRPVTAWLGGQRLTVDPDAALNCWSLAGDVALSLGLPWDDRGHVADRCYAKLTAANVPYLFGVDAYVPRWTPRELRYLRRRLLAAVALIRSRVATTDGPPPAPA